MKFPKVKKWFCNNFGCDIITYTSPGNLYIECKRCGDVLHINPQEPNWENKAMVVLLYIHSIFSSINSKTVADFRIEADKQ